jgi:hypothetical protein
MVNPAPVRSPRLVVPRRWQIPLLAGFCFGLGYGLVQRLMQLDLPRQVQLVESFRMREFPGTTLESLRLKRGEEPRSIRADLGVLEQQEQQRKAEAELRQQQQELEAERQREQQAAPLSLEPEPASAPRAPLDPPSAPPPELPTP